MFVIYSKEKQNIPLKVWGKKEEIEDECISQAINLTNLPFAFHHVALMPDCHPGFGMPIGGVLATKNCIIPYAIGSDIGCGMRFIHTNIPASLLQVETPNENLAQTIAGNIIRDVPLGFNHHKEPQKDEMLEYYYDDFSENMYYKLGKELLPELERSLYQLGTLGSGNHFIELQKDEEDNLGIMIHSGSRNLGYQICKYFHNIAKELNRKWCSSISTEELAFLPIDSKEGHSYIQWMDLALTFAFVNREFMMKRIKNIVFNMVKEYTDFNHIETIFDIDIHHNYAKIENHFNENVWVHRKGAIQAYKGMLGIIPGAMGSYSYIVEGLGNSDSFCSCSHGAGRKMGRKEAERTFETKTMFKDLEKQNTLLFTPNKNVVLDEVRWAYKDIEEVMEESKDLVSPIMKLKGLVVIKG